MHSYVGTSGWSYKDWRPEFYPTSKSREWLAIYASHFSTVEMNNSFYRLPTLAMVQRWCEQVPNDFQFSLKAPKVISHIQKLLNCEDALASFNEIIHAFGQHAGPILFQFPASFHYSEGTLENFLPLLAKQNQYTFEFRHTSWFHEKTYLALKEHNVALCWSHMKEWIAPLTITADFIYVRLHGATGWFRGAYSTFFLKELSEHMKKTAPAYVYFNNTMSGLSTLANAKELSQLSN